MAGTLTISTLSDGTNSTSATNCISGSAKAWCNYNGVAQTIKASYNVSSVTRNSTGNYTFNFTNALVDANYAVAIGIVGQDTGGTQANFNIYGSNSGASNKTTTAIQMVSGVTSSNAFYDRAECSISIFR